MDAEKIDAIGNFTYRVMEISVLLFVFLFSLGCIQALQCNKNTCPTGITTHNPDLQRGLVVEDKAERVASFARNMLYEVGIIAHSCGVREPRELTRDHAQLITAQGIPAPMAESFPDSMIKAQYVLATDA